MIISKRLISEADEHVSIARELLTEILAVPSPKKLEAVEREIFSREIVNLAKECERQLTDIAELLKELEARNNENLARTPNP